MVGIKGTSFLLSLATKRTCRTRIRQLHHKNEMTGKTSDGFVVYRKEKIFDDGSRVVEESTLLSKLATTTTGGTNGGIGSSNRMMTLMHGTTNIVDGSGSSTRNNIVDIEKGNNRNRNYNDEKNQLQPMYNPDGNPYVVAVLMVLKYGLPIIIFIYAWTKRAKRVKDAPDDGDVNNYYNQNYDNGYWYNNP